MTHDRNAIIVRLSRSIIHTSVYHQPPSSCIPSITLPCHPCACSYTLADSQARISARCVYPLLSHYVVRYAVALRDRTLGLSEFFLPAIRRSSLTCHCHAAFRTLQFLLDISLHMWNIIYDPHTATLLVDSGRIKLLMRFDLREGGGCVDTDIQKLQT